MSANIYDLMKQGNFRDIGDTVVETIKKLDHDTAVNYVTNILREVHAQEMLDSVKEMK